MKEIKPKHMYRIDRPLDLTHVLSLFLNNPDDVFVCTDETNRQLENRPDIFPYIAVFHNVDLSMSGGLLSADVEFITVGAFANREQGFESNLRLFEFHIKRTYTESLNVRVSRYQIPARDILEAHVKLGQAYHNDDSYELEVLSCTQVR